MQTEAKERLLGAAIDLVRRQGYNTTTVADICQEAKVTKGSFFHHFPTKDELAVRAIHRWHSFTEQFFAEAPYQQIQDPLQWIFGYLELRESLIHGELPNWTCFCGTLIQETYQSHPEFQEACAAAVLAHLEPIAANLKLAKQNHCPTADWDSESVAIFFQTALQGGFIMSKLVGSPEPAKESIYHLRAYIKSLFPSVDSPLSDQDSKHIP